MIWRDYMEDKITKVSDMYFAAALLSYGMEIKDVDATNPRRQEFLFYDKPLSVKKETDFGVTQMEVIDAGQVNMMFASKTLWFPPSYPECIRSIKNLLHANK